MMGKKYISILISNLIKKESGTKKMKMTKEKQEEDESEEEDQVEWKIKIRINKKTYWLKSE